MLSAKEIAVAAERMPKRVLLLAAACALCIVVSIGSAVIMLADWHHRTVVDGAVMMVTLLYVGFTLARIPAAYRYVCAYADTEATKASRS
ncbi:hypothetical protein ACH4VR_29565 [Streptomyces sp. NPDC020883]|uniref:hypothetical protein n=1 Tax=Streptomyces sp. NPDC020883 TaxID=3365099 RepID=UPI0037A64643